MIIGKHLSQSVAEAKAHKEAKAKWNPPLRRVQKENFMGAEITLYENQINGRLRAEIVRRGAKNLCLVSTDNGESWEDNRDVPAW